MSHDFLSRHLQFVMGHTKMISFILEDSYQTIVSALIFILQNFNLYFCCFQLAYLRLNFPNFNQNFNFDYIFINNYIID